GGGALVRSAAAACGAAGRRCARRGAARARRAARAGADHPERAAGAAGLREAAARPGTSLARRGAGRARRARLPRAPAELAAPGHWPDLDPARRFARGGRLWLRRAVVGRRLARAEEARPG